MFDSTHICIEIIFILPGLHFGNPAIWGPVIAEVETLKSGAWLGGACFEFYLHFYWLENKPTSRVWYLTTAAILRCVAEAPDGEEIKNLRLRLGISRDMTDDEEYPRRPVVFGRHHKNHYFSVAFDYEKDAVYVFGSSTTRVTVTTVPEKHWNRWKGPLLWKNVAKIFGWVLPPIVPTVYYVDWLQVRKIHSCNEMRTRGGSLSSLTERCRLWTDLSVRHRGTAVKGIRVFQRLNSSSCH